MDGVVLNLFEEQLGLVEHLPFRQDVGLPELLPVEGRHIEHFTQLVRREGQEGFKGNGQIGSELQGDVDDGLHALRVSLDDLPRLFISDVFVADACQVHGFLLCFAELESLNECLHIILDGSKLGECRFVCFGQFTTCGHYTIIIFLGELEGTVHEVTIHGHQLVVATCLEICPGEVIVLGFWCIGCQHIAQLVLTVGQFFQIFVQPNGIVLRSRNLLTFEVQELVAGHIVRQDIIAMCFQH